MPWSLQVVEISGGRISELHMFLDTAALFPAFGLPAHLPGAHLPEYGWTRPHQAIDD